MPPPKKSRLTSKKSNKQKSAPATPKSWPSTHQPKSHSLIYAGPPPRLTLHPAVQRLTLSACAHPTGCVRLFLLNPASRSKAPVLWQSLLGLFASRGLRAASTEVSLQRRGSQVWVWVHRERLKAPAGTGTAAAALAWRAGDTGIEIMLAATREGFRGRGLAGALVAELVERRRGRALALHSRPGAVAFWKGQGFVPAERQGSGPDTAMRLLPAEPAPPPCAEEAEALPGLEMLWAAACASWGPSGGDTWS